MSVRVRPAEEADIVDIANVAMAAFDPSTDAIARRLFPSHLQDPNASKDDAHRQWVTLRKSARLHAKNSAIMVAVDDTLDGQVVGYAVWFIPVAGVENGPPPPRKVFAGADQSAFAELRQIMEADERETFGDEGSGDVWTLDSVGVYPEHQKRGIGRMLLNWGVEKATEQGKDCYLVATPAGSALYRAAGFESVRTLDIFGVPHVSMMRHHVAN